MNENIEDEKWVFLKKSKEFGKNDVRQNHKFDNEMKFSQKRRGESH